MRATKSKDLLASKESSGREFGMKFLGGRRKKRRKIGASF
jgi:hypothetical protein